MYFLCIAIGSLSQNYLNIYYYLCKHKCNRIFDVKYNNDTSYSETISNVGILINNEKDQTLIAT